RVAELHAPDFLFTESHPVEMCEIDGRLRSGRCCHNKYMALPVSPRPGEERGTARLGRHGACCLSVRLYHGCGCLAASKARRQWSRRRKLRLLADPGFPIWFRSPPLAGSPSSPRKISLRLLWVSCSCRGDLRSDSGRCGKPTTCVPDYVKHQFVLGLRGTARVND